MVSQRQLTAFAIGTIIGIIYTGNWTNLLPTAQTDLNGVEPASTTADMDGIHNHAAVLPRTPVPGLDISSHLRCRSSSSLPSSNLSLSQDPWMVGDVWGNGTHSLHVLEAEVLQPDTRSTAPAVLSFLAIVEHNDDLTPGHGMHLNGRTEVVAIDPEVARPLVELLQCSFNNVIAHSTPIRTIFFKDIPRPPLLTQKYDTIGMLLQCAVPNNLPGSGTGTTRAPFNVTVGSSTAASVTRLRFELCPTPRVEKKFKVLICTKHFYGDILNTSLATAWMEYHLLAGVQFVEFFEYGNGRHAEVMRRYVEAGVASHTVSTMHPPMNAYGRPAPWQMYHNTACYMRNRHRAEWIATIDMDELIDVQHTGPSGDASTYSDTQIQEHAPWHIHDHLNSLPPYVTETSLMHCQLVRMQAEGVTDQTGNWTAFGIDRIGGISDPGPGHYALNLTVLNQPGQQVYRNCRYTVRAPKALGRAAETPFSYIHWNSCPRLAGCDWRWHTEEKPASCSIRTMWWHSTSLSQGKHAQKYFPPKEDCHKVQVQGLNHGKCCDTLDNKWGARWVYLLWQQEKVKGVEPKRIGPATPAFTNTSFNILYWERLRQVGLLPPEDIGRK